MVGHELVAAVAGVQEHGHRDGEAEGGERHGQADGLDHLPVEAADRAEQGHRRRPGRRQEDQDGQVGEAGRWLTTTTPG